MTHQWTVKQRLHSLVFAALSWVERCGSQALLR